MQLIFRIKAISLFIIFYLSSITHPLSGQSHFTQKLGKFQHLENSQQWDSLINHYAFLYRQKQTDLAEKFALDLEEHLKSKKQYEGLWRLYNHQMIVASDRGNLSLMNDRKQRLIQLSTLDIPMKNKIRQLLNFGYIHYYHGKPDLAIDYLKEGLQMALSWNQDPYLTYQFYSNLGGAYISKEYLRTASHYYLLALQYAEQHRLPRFDLYNNLAAVSINSRDYKSAKQYLDKIPKDSVKDPYLLVLIQTNRFKIALRNHDSTRAKPLLSWLNSHYDDIKQVQHLVLASIMEYHIIFQPKEYDSFLKTHPEIFDISEEQLGYSLNVWNLHPSFAKKLPLSFIQKLQQIDEQSVSASIYTEIQLCLAYWSGNSAYWEHFEKRRRASLENLDSLLIQDLSANLRTLKLEYERSELKESLDRLKFERWLIFGSSSLILGLLVITILVYRKSIQRKEIENQLTQELLDSQNQQLAYSNHIMQKAQNWLKEIQDMQDISNIMEVRKRLINLKNDFSIIGKVNDRIQKREDFDKNESAIPTELLPLNKTELTVARFLMRGMRTKEIGIFMELSPVYINNVRYRIRKKLQIPKEVSVEEFLQKINENQ